MIPSTVPTLWLYYEIHLCWEASVTSLRHCLDDDDGDDDDDDDDDDEEKGQGGGQEEEEE